VQEGLTNVLKHARASEARVRVHRLGPPEGPARIEVEVRDDGVGFDPRSPTEDRLGLLGMRERIDLAGGSFRCESSPGGGTRLAATFPLDPGPPPDEHSA
jgi:signal transduction histidine kinase